MSLPCLEFKFSKKGLGKIDKIKYIFENYKIVMLFHLVECVQNIENN